ncbi:MFS transporter (organic cation transporter) [Sarotherodon galilaeus]
MAVEQLRLWKHDIAERCTHLTESIFDRYTDKDDALDATGITEIPNHVHRLRALVEYSLQDEVRAKLLLSLLCEINPYIYKDLVQQGPKGKTERKLTQFKLTRAAKRMLDSTLPTFMFHSVLRNRSLLDIIKTVDEPLDIMVRQELILPKEQYMLYHMFKSTEGKVRALGYLFGCPTVPAETKASISLILAVYNLHVFGISPDDPYSLLEIDCNS